MPVLFVRSWWKTACLPPERRTNGGLLRSGGSVMVWGVSGQEKTSLVIVNGNVTAQWHRSHSASDCPAVPRPAVTWCPSPARPRLTTYSQNPATHPWCQHRQRGAAVCTLATHVPTPSSQPTRTGLGHPKKMATYPKKVT